MHSFLLSHIQNSDGLASVFDFMAQWNAFKKITVFDKSSATRNKLCFHSIPSSASLYSNKCIFSWVNG